jgi:hypothetical protein
MNRTSTFIAVVWPFVRANETNGLSRISRDRDLAWLEAASANLDVRLLMACSPPGLTDIARTVPLDSWLRTVEAADGAFRRRRRGRHRGIR